MENSSGIKDLSYLLSIKGITHAVISPGSRNAPIIRALFEQENIHCYSIPDERSAAFFALGMAQQLQHAVALVCTSGTAAINYAPAIAEAHYQKIPLLVLTADRPVEWIDQGDGQTIRQRNLYGTYVNASFELPQTISNKDEDWHNARIISEAINACYYPAKGAVHINIPLKEPLYGKLEKNLPGLPKSFNLLKGKPQLDALQLNVLAKEWTKYNKVMILCGLLPAKNEELNKLLELFATKHKVLVFTETTSQLYSHYFFPCIDRLIHTIKDEDKELLKPDLLISLGGHIVSKKVKFFLREYAPQKHWHISETAEFMDTFQSLTEVLNTVLESFFSTFEKLITPKNEQYFNYAFGINEKQTQKHNLFNSNCAFSDMKVFDLLSQQLPQGWDLQIGNSSPIRYAQLFEWKTMPASFSNRGTSGIEGCVSTALGASLINKNKTLLLIGDISFFYDSNGLWNKYLHESFAIILINNGGGGIFRIIEGPQHTDFFENFLETHHQLNAKGICDTFGVQYYAAENEMEFTQFLQKIFNETHATSCLLEVFTPRLENDKILKSYFEFLKQ